MTTPLNELEYSAMETSPTTDLHQAAVDCVEMMSDVFWDFEPERDIPLEFNDPHDIAVAAVEKTLRDVVAGVEALKADLRTLRTEYEILLVDLPDRATDTRIVRALVDRADWTDKGARELLLLARRYGTSILRNATALAEALKIEDGSSGL